VRQALLALFCALALGPWLAPAPAIAKDTLLHVELDGRRLDALGPSAIVHHGRAFVNVVRIVRGFNGLLTFGKSDRSVVVTIGHQSARFVIGSRSGQINGNAATFGAAPFVLNGDVYVPLDPIATIADASLKVDVRHHVARMTSAAPPA
jgi:hypothetical protein